MLLFKYKFIYFNWRLTTLQYCIGFAICQHESAIGIHVFPILDPPKKLKLRKKRKKIFSFCTPLRHKVSIQQYFSLLFTFKIKPYYQINRKRLNTHLITTLPDSNLIFCILPLLGIPFTV